MKPSPRRLKTIRHLRLGSDDHLILSISLAGRDWTRRLDGPNDVLFRKARDNRSLYLTRSCHVFRLA